MVPKAFVPREKKRIRMMDMMSDDGLLNGIYMVGLGYFGTEL
jgi:hypothetical protein